MRNPKIVLLLKQLNKAEIKAFDKFIASPYFNGNKNLNLFWKYIKAKAPNYSLNLSEIEQLFASLTPKQIIEVDEQRLYQLCFQLLTLLEEFLAIERFRGDKFSFKKQVADAYYAKGMKDNFEKRYRKLQRSFNSDDFLTSTELNQKLTLHHHFYFNEFNFKGDKRSKDLEQCSLTLEEYYVQQKLIYTIEWLSSNLRYNYDKRLIHKCFVLTLGYSNLNVI